MVFQRRPTKIKVDDIEYEIEGEKLETIPRASNFRQTLDDLFPSDTDHSFLGPMAQSMEFSHHVEHSSSSENEEIPTQEEARTTLATSLIDT